MTKTNCGICAVDCCFSPLEESPAEDTAENEEEAESEAVPGFRVSFAGLVAD